MFKKKIFHSSRLKVSLLFFIFFYNNTSQIICPPGAAESLLGAGAFTKDLKEAYKEIENLEKKLENKTAEANMYNALLQKYDGHPLPPPAQAGTSVAAASLPTTTLPGKMPDQKDSASGPDINSDDVDKALGFHAQTKVNLEEFRRVISDFTPQIEKLSGVVNDLKGDSFLKKIQELTKKLKGNKSAQMRAANLTGEEQGDLSKKINSLFQKIVESLTQVEDLKQSIEAINLIPEHKIDVEYFMKKIKSLNEKIEKLSTASKVLPIEDTDLNKLLEIIKSMPKIESAELFKSALLEVNKINKFILSIKPTFDSLVKLFENQKRLNKKYIEITIFNILDESLNLEKDVFRMVREKDVLGAMQLLKTKVIS